jgi:hypothetical protein
MLSETTFSFTLLKLRDLSSSTSFTNYSKRTLYILSIIYILVSESIDVVTEYVRKVLVIDPTLK